MIFLYALGSMASVGIYSVILFGLWTFTQMEFLEIVAVDTALMIVVSFALFTKIQKIEKRLRRRRNEK